MPRVLLDTGAWVALLDEEEEYHRSCMAFFKGFTGQLFTTEPVLTETLYLLLPSFRAQRLAIDFVLNGGVELVSQSPDSLRRSLTLMEKYKNLPMDFADATLVVLAEELECYDIFSLDKKGFAIYRVGRQGFKIWPE